VRDCSCREDQRARYRAKLSGPLLDRVDLRLSVPRLTRHELLGAEPAETSSVVRARVIEARQRQRDRLRGTPWTCNAHLPGPVARRQAALTDTAEHLLGRAVERSALSGRGFDRVVKVARTVADLEASAEIRDAHVLEALSYREAFETGSRARAS
jgi:magnesium chelatase family protein